ncbi:Phosphatidylinositolglycan class N-domain-containing protein [Dichomitus squalens]|uniref:GPI ethanolamine phosphate transferase 1 n=1 Tax=Dichomitus squalens TaxID=114155 RepID=A0A4Q9PK57_9APHY|nr:Phosphatidylinositolglycan class N-domain-containing protein [Dichomitus squalens]
MRCCGNDRDWIYGHENVKNAREAWCFKAVVITLICGLASSTVLVYLIVGSLRAKRGVPPILRTPGWIILLSNGMLPFIVRVGRSNPSARLLSIFLGVGMWFIRVAVSVEGVFYVAFALMLYLWVEVEYVWHRDQPLGSESKVKDEEGCVTYQLKGEDLGIALLFLLFMQIAFFGPGNISSIASFYLDLVYRLISRYNPYLLIVLLMFAPFLILALTFSVLHARLSLPPFNLFVIVLALSDVMTLTFFLKVRHVGSWFDISQSFYEQAHSLSSGPWWRALSPSCSCVVHANTRTLSDLGTNHRSSMGKNEGWVWHRH